VPILSNLCGVVDSFKLPGGIMVERKDSDIDANGYPIEDTGGPTIFAVNPATVHTLQGKELLKLPEGDRTKEVIQVFTKVRLRTAYEGTDEMPDVVLYTPQGEGVEGRYVVKISEDWIAQSGHYRCICVREENG
jgi:hypothetical protein